MSQMRYIHFLTLLIISQKVRESVGNTSAFKFHITIRAGPDVGLTNDDANDPWNFLVRDQATVKHRFCSGF